MKIQRTVLQLECVKLEARWQMIVNDETEDQERDNDGNSKGLHHK